MSQDQNIYEAALRGASSYLTGKSTPENALFDEAKFRQYIPPEMLQEKRWVRYFLKPKPEGGTAKIPLGNHSDPSTWSTFDDAVKDIENHQQGIGYCFLG